MNTQGCLLPEFNLDELPVGAPPPLGAAAGEAGYAERGRGPPSSGKDRCPRRRRRRGAGPEIARFLDLADGVAVTSPLVSGVIPYHHPRNMTVGGSKGSLCGNYAMENADLLVALGTRFVCQSDSSRTDYPNVRRVINISADLEPLMHYNRDDRAAGRREGDAGAADRGARRRKTGKPASDSAWFSDCRRKKQEWDAFKAERYATPRLYDEVWKEQVLTQPAAIKAATDWARAKGAVAFFDAGDVQANGFQIVEDERLGQTFTETGASYMGFAVSAVLATALGQEAVLRPGAERRRLVHHVPANPHRRGGARRPRLHPDSRQPPHGRHLGPATGAVRA